MDQNAVPELGNRLAVFGGDSLTYDADGNLTRKLRPGYDDLQPRWNSLGQMSGAWRYQRGTVGYGYDAAGPPRAPHRAGRHHHDGDDLLMELDAAGQPIARTRTTRAWTSRTACT